MLRYVFVSFLHWILCELNENGVKKIRKNERESARLFGCCTGVGEILKGIEYRNIVHLTMQRAPYTHFNTLKIVQKSITGEYNTM